MCRDVVERRRVAVLVEPRARLGPALLRPVAEGQQRFLAAERLALQCDREDLLRRHVGRLPLQPELPGGVHEDAVMAPIAAQRRERDEHLARIGDDPGSPGRGRARRRASRRRERGGDRSRRPPRRAAPRRPRGRASGPRRRARAHLRSSGGRSSRSGDRAGSPLKSPTARGVGSPRSLRLCKHSPGFGSAALADWWHGDAAARLDSTRGRAVRSPSAPWHSAGGMCVIERSTITKVQLDRRRLELAARRPRAPAPTCPASSRWARGSPRAAATSPSSAVVARAVVIDLEGHPDFQRVVLDNQPRGGVGEGTAAGRGGEGGGCRRPRHRHSDPGQEAPGASPRCAGPRSRLTRVASPWRIR